MRKKNDGRKPVTAKYVHATMLKTVRGGFDPNKVDFELKEIKS